MRHLARFISCLCLCLLIYILFWSQTPNTLANMKSWLTLQTLKETQEILDWKAEQQRRKLVLMDVCKKWPPKADEYLPHSQYEKSSIPWSILVDDRHKAIYCYVPKVSCSNWKRIWMILTGMTKEKNPLNIPDTKPHLLHNKMMLAEQPYNASILQNKLDTYTKLIVVRDPFERLLSAYRDKLENGNNSWFLAQYNNEMFQHNKELRIPTFSAFVDYVLKFSSGILDEHWRPYHKLCFPCAIQYDVIAKYETLAADSEHFLRLIGAPDDLHFPPYVPSKTSSLLPQYMANLSQHQRHGLYHLYRRDFEAFEYQPFGGIV